MTKKKKRLDDMLVERGLVQSRQRAQGLILAAKIRVDGKVVDKAGAFVSDEAEIELVQTCPFVSRGGLKLQAALEAFKLSVEDKVCADVGASTGGFSDVLLQGGAAKLYAIDLAFGELAWKIREDERVVVMERTNAAFLEKLPELVDFISVDVSLLSLRKLLPTCKKWLKNEGQLVVLIKPQYEATSEQLPKGAVIQDAKVHQVIVEDLLKWAVSIELFPAQLIASPIKGGSGNREFLALLEQKPSDDFDLSAIVY